MSHVLCAPLRAGVRVIDPTRSPMQHIRRAIHFIHCLLWSLLLKDFSSFCILYYYFFICNPSPVYSFCMDKWLSFYLPHEFIHIHYIWRIEYNARTFGDSTDKSPHFFLMNHQINCQSYYKNYWIKKRCVKRAFIKSKTATNVFIVSTVSLSVLLFK